MKDSNYGSCQMLFHPSVIQVPWEDMGTPDLLSPPHPHCNSISSYVAF